MKCLYQIADYDVYSFSLEPIDSKMYCILKDSDALIIDPCLSGEAVNFLKNNKIENILALLTHEHIDHISGVNLLRNNFNVKVICSKKCAERIVNPRKNLAAYIEGMFSVRSEKELEQIKSLNLLDYCCRADETFEKESIFNWFDLNIKCIELPGHSPGGIGIIVNDKYIFSGDNYIFGEEVITRLPGSNKKIYEEVTKPFFDKLGEETVIFPGHGGVF